jgi:putative protein-disulfide isomerase
MKKSLLIYCYDSYCGWCFGFSEVMKKIEEAYKSILDLEVLSGGMILPEKPVHINATADYISKAYQVVEETSGVKFGSDFLWHIFNPHESDWYPNSEKPAIALCIFKEYFPDKAIAFSAALQYALFVEGRDLTDDEAYRHLLKEYSIDENDFYQKLHSQSYKDVAHNEFAIVKKLQVEGFPALYLQTTENKFYFIANGYTKEEIVRQNINKILELIQ